MQEYPHKQSLERREFLKTSAKFGAVASLASFGGLALSACSEDSKGNLQGIENTSGSEKAPITQNIQGVNMEFVTFNNGIKMPILGYGVYQIEPKDTQRCVEDAISVGYRSIDTAQAYFNEAEVGAAIKTALNGGLKREEIFITTKLWLNNYKEERALRYCEESLRKLGLDYIDLMLLHQPYNDTYGAWRALERFYKEGRFKAIGISNFYPDRVVDFALNNEIKPMINQIELHPFYQKQAEQELNSEFGILTQSWASFAEGKNGLFTNETLKNIGAKYNKTAAQVVLRWLIQRGIVVIPKTTRKERMQENINVFDFALSNEDMQTIATLDTGKTLFANHQDPQFAKWLIEINKDKFQ